MSVLGIPLALLALAVWRSAACADAQPREWAQVTSPTYRLVADQSGADDRVPYTAAPWVLAQDGIGFIWIGTENGIERWDGREMRVYPARPNDPCALRGGLVSALYVDHAKRLWVGTVGGDIVYYDPRGDCFRTVLIDRPAAAKAPVESIADDDRGGWWIGTPAGMWRLSADLARLTPIEAMQSEAGRLGHERIVRMLRDRDGALWVATDDGVARRPVGGGPFAYVALPAKTRARALLQSGDGRIWVGTVGRGAYVIDPATLQVRPVASIARLQPMPLLFAAVEAPTGEIWFGTPDQGVLALDPHTEALRWIRHQRGVVGSLGEDAVSDLLRDRDGQVWVAGESTIGFLIAEGRVATVRGGVDAGGLPEGSVLAALRMQDGRIAVGVNRRIVLLDPTAKDAASVRVDVHTPPAAISSLATTDGRDLFAGMAPVGLIWIDPTSGRSSLVPLPGPTRSAHVLSLLADGDRLWVGALEGLWLVTRRADPGHASFPWVAERLADVENVRAIAVAPAGRRWLGTGDGLLLADDSGRAPQPVRVIDADGRDVGGLQIVTLYADARQRLWIGTNDAGLYVVDATSAVNGRVQLLRHFVDGLPGTTVGALVADSRGDLWLGMDRGIAKVNTTDFSVQRLGRADGVAIMGYTAGYAADPTGDTLIFGGVNGLTLIHSAQPVVARAPPPLVFTRLGIDDRELKVSGYDARPEETRLDVPPGAHRLTVGFTALEFADPSAVDYAYRLDGYDRDWSRSGPAARLATYRNLNPGSYRFRVREISTLGDALGPERQLSIRVAAAWYQTMWFHALVGLAAVLSVVLIVQARTVYLKVRQRELEAVVVERTRALVQMTESRNALIENLAHDLRTPLTSLRAYLESLSLKNLTLTDGDRRRYVAIALRQAERLHRLVRELFDLVRLEQPRPSMNVEAFNPAELVQDVVQEFGYLTEDRAIDVDIEAGAEGVALRGDISLIQRMIDNLVDNAVRHTPAGGRITVTLSRQAAHLVLAVKDTGAGIPPADLDRIFERYERSDGLTSGAGLGLAIVKRIVELHGGVVRVDSRVGEGSVFTVRLPLTGPTAADHSGGTSL